MAKFERRIIGDFDKVLKTCMDAVTQGSMSTTYEDGSDFEIEGTRVAVRVFERYSMLGKNRVSMNLTIFGRGNELFLSAITSGGSQAVLLKINTFGEKAFLDTLAKELEKY